MVTGRIGSGKTTLLRVLLGLLPKDEGEIRWNGEPVEKPGEFFTPPTCAYTAQVPRLFSDSLRDNILMGLDKSDDDIYRAVRSAVMEQGPGATSSDGLDTMVGPKGRQALRRADPAHRRGAHVRARAGAAGVRRPFQRAGCGDRAHPVGARLRASRA